MKNTVVLLLVIVMILGSIAGILMYFSSGHGTNSPFADIPAPIIESFTFADFTGADLSDMKIENISEILYTFTFDTSTKWPETEDNSLQLLANQVMESGKYLGLGLSELHQNGVTGKGISVAIIDRTMLKEHEAFQDNLNYFEVSSSSTHEEELSSHGSALAGIVGGSSGVAPDATLYYFAVSDDEDPYDGYKKAMEKLLDFQKTLPEEEKIRLVLLALGPDPLQIAADPEGPVKGLADALNKAKAENIVVLYPGMQTSFPITGTGCPPTMNRDEADNYQVWSWTLAKKQIGDSLQSHNANSWDEAIEILKKLLTDMEELNSIQAEAINTFLYIAYVYSDYIEFNDWLESIMSEPSDLLAAPSDFIAVPNSHGPQQYTYYGSGILDWSTAYVAGLVTLGFQVNPTLTENQIFQALWESGTPFYGTSRLVCPLEFIRAIGEA